MASFFSNIFPPTSKSDWIAQVHKELKLAQNDENALKGLRWHSPEGFSLDPYFTADDLTRMPSVQSIQAAQKQHPGWLNTPEKVVTGDKSDNASLRDALARGADAFVLSIPAHTNWTTENLARLLNGIKLSDTPVFVRLPAEQTVSFIQTLKTVAPYQLKGGLLTDSNESTAEVTRQTLNSPQFRTICASSHAFHNAGATATQELAFTLASLTDTYDELTNAGLTLEQLIPKTVLSMSVGTSYFLEIAKLRALRVLVSRLVAAYPPAAGHQASFFLHCQTSTFYDAAATPNTNLLRATTEAMAAVIGGCDALTVHPYDAILGTTPDSNLSTRMARNVSILLKDECYLDKVADPAAGSYYIETLTDTLVEAAWTMFLAVEEQGGFANALASGFVSAELDKAYQEKVEAIRAGKVLVGVTKFRFDEPGSSSYIPPIGPDTALPHRRLTESFD